MSNSIHYILKHERLEYSIQGGAKIFLPHTRLGLNNSDIVKYISRVRQRPGWLSSTIYENEIVSRFSVANHAELFQEFDLRINMGDKYEL